MHVHFGSDLLHAEWHESVVCIGTFDGVHRGHQAVIRRAVEKARELGLPCALLTFDRHPAAILAPDRCPAAIASLQANLQHFEDLGVAVAVVMPFTKELSETSAEAFFQDVVVDKLGGKSLVVGHDFAFGKARQGTPQWLSARIETEVIPPFQLEGMRVSSSAIRSSVEAGDVERAAKLLGRDFEMPGIVVSGERLGRQLGYPTINLARSFRQVMPADGVYGGACSTPYGTYKAAISVGCRPTVGGEHTVEAFLLDYPGNALYGAAVVLKFAQRIRDQQRFDSLDELKNQMQTDVALISTSL
jgi:riboflavin kinase/FMN adenylyltransferase